MPTITYRTFISSQIFAYYSTTYNLNKVNMHTTTTTTLSVLLAAFLPATFAAPSFKPASPLHVRNTIATVAFRQQLQNSDQANHWVV